VRYAYSRGELTIEKPEELCLGKACLTEHHLEHRGWNISPRLVANADAQHLACR